MQSLAAVHVHIYYLGQNLLFLYSFLSPKVGFQVLGHDVLYQPCGGIQCLIIFIDKTCMPRSRSISSLQLYSRIALLHYSIP